MSTTHTALGVRVISRMPPRVRCSLIRSRDSTSASFLVSTVCPPVVSMSSSSLRRCSRLKTVWKLVSMPPSQRSVTYGIPTRPACSTMASCAWRFVPMNMMVPPCATVSLTKSYARSM